MSAEIREPGFLSVVGREVDVQRLATGFMFTEGPLWHPTGKFLLFSDMPGDIIRKWSASEGVRAFRQPSNMANGLTFDREGRLLACEHATSRVTCTERDGSISVLASHYRGKELNSPNDIVVKRDGAIYFSDPTYGRVEYYGLPRPLQLAFRGVYRMGPDRSELIVLADDFGEPNGLCFSPDETLLYINDTDRNHIRVFDVAADGTLRGGDIFAETTGEGEGAPDGMKIDSEGNIYCCGPGGIHVFNPNGVCLGVIRTPEPAANFAFGGDDYRTVFITASTSVYSATVRIPGLPAF